MARYGGEEFIVLSSDIDRDGAANFAEKLRRAVAALDIPAEGKTLRVSVSVGVCWRQPDRRELQPPNPHIGGDGSQASGRS